MRTRFGTLLGATALLVVSAACKKSEPVPEPAPPPPPPAPVAVSDVDLGKAIDGEKRVVLKTSEFGTRDTIYASVSTTGASAGATLTARWTFENGTVVDSTSMTIAPTGPTQSEFHIMKGSAWPKGKYRVAILLNGVQASEKEFEVKG